MFQLDTDFPGGNIILDRIDGNTVYIRQDQRGSTQRWFYWHFRVKGAAGRVLRFVFTDWDVIGSRGPCISNDGGATYSWERPNVTVGPSSFEYGFGPTEEETFFCFCLPYTQRHLDEFLNQHPSIRREALCISRKDREVERLHIGTGLTKIIITCRHHACETSASYLLEGILGSLLLPPGCEAAIIPFVDKDGVEDGDQGKARNGRDHNRDYEGASLYAETAAIRDWLPKWARDGLVVGLDLHSPWMKGGINEIVYQVGSADPRIWAEQQRFGPIWQRHVNGELAYRSHDDLPFGKDWNVATNYAGRSFGRYLATFPSVKLSTSIETPYACVYDVNTSPENLRELGNSLASALCDYLTTLRAYQL